MVKSRSQHISIFSRSLGVSLTETEMVRGESSKTGNGGDTGSIVGGVLMTSMGTVVIPVDAPSSSNISMARRWNPDVVYTYSVTKSGE